jgi:hypothetical protein
MSEGPTNVKTTKKGWQEFLLDFPIVLMVPLAGQLMVGVAIFFLATTDISKVWHCFFFALTCAMAGQRLVLKTVNSIGFDVRLGINVVNRLPGVTPATTSTQHQNQPTNETFRKTTNPFFNTQH